MVVIPVVYWTIKYPAEFLIVIENEVDVNAAAPVKKPLIYIP